MNNFSIEMKINDVEVSITDYEKFEQMVNTFLWYNEHVIQSNGKLKFNSIVLNYKNQELIFNDPLGILFTCVYLSKTHKLCVKEKNVVFSINSSDFYNNYMSAFVEYGKMCLTVMAHKKDIVFNCYMEGNNKHNCERIYEMFEENIETVKEKMNKIDKFIEQRPTIKKEPDVQKEVEQSWMLGYYVQNELKHIKELLDTDLPEAKKRISVMEYMINSTVKI